MSDETDQQTESKILNVIKYCSRAKDPYLDLTEEKLTLIPRDLLQAHHVKYLYLADNQLTKLPDLFFDDFPNICWLDIRYNQLQSLPSLYIGQHKCLETLLLQSNELTTIPLELSQIATLKSICLSGNPLKFPPAEYLNDGSSKILQFLRKKLKEATQATLKNELSNISETLESTRRQKSASSTSSNQSKPKLSKRSVMSFKVDLYPEPPSPESVERNIAKEIKSNKLRMKNLKIEKELQKVKDDDKLKEWRQEAKRLQELKNYKAKQQGFIDFTETIDNAPFGIVNSAKKITSRDQLRQDQRNPSKSMQKIKPKSLSPRTKIALEIERARADKELESKIHEHVRMIEERRKARIGANPQQELMAAKEELAIAQKLQGEIQLRRKQMEYGLKGIDHTKVQQFSRR